MKKYITITISILLLITITTPFTVNAKTAKETLLENVVTTGDGLYKDEYEEGRYIYKGENPNNYITFNNEYAGWRILSVEKDGTIKIIKNQSIGNMIFDDGDNGTYCNGSYDGCNAWAATQDKTTVLEDADINKYLNETYYQSMNDKSKEYIQKHIFNTGGSKITNIENIISNEKKHQWTGNIGLISYSEFVRTQEWQIDTTTLTPLINDRTPRQSIFTLKNHKALVWSEAYTIYKNPIAPVLYLKANITLTGSGTQDNPYTIESEVTINLETFGDLDKDLQFKLDTAGKTLSEIKEEIDDQIGTKIEKDGQYCTLDSWYLDKDLKNRFDENTPINNNITLFGRWKCRETETVNVPDTLLQIPNWIINLGCSITIVGILLIVFIIKKKNTRNEE